jgi:hypothetical protein
LGFLVIILAFVYFVVLSVSSLCLGGALLRRFGLGPGTITSARGRIGLEITLGMGLWGLIYLPITAVPGFWIMFGKAFFILLMLLVIARWHRNIEDVLEAYKSWKARRRESGRKISLHSLFSLLLAVLFVLAFLNACGPISAWDEIVDHLPKARFIAEHGVFVDDTSSPFSGYPALCELLFAPLMGLTDELARVTVFSFAIAMFFMLAGFARMFLPPGWANPVAIIFFTMPLVSDLVRTALVDVPLASFCFAAFYLIALALIDEGEDKSLPVRCLFIAGIFLGFALSVKYNGLLVICSWLIVYPITLLFKRVGARRFFGWILTLFIPALVVSGGWYARNILLYGNPVYPFMQAVFSGSTDTALSLEAFARPEMQKSWVELALYPIRLSFDYDLIRHWYRAITPAFLCFIPLGLVLGRRDKFKPVFHMGIWLGLIHLWLAFSLSPGHTRYLLPLWAVWSALAAYGMARASEGSRFIRNAVIPIVLIVPLLFMLAIQGKTTWKLMPYFDKQITKAEVIAEELPPYEFMRKMADFIPEDGRVLTIEPRVYYMPRDAIIGAPGIEAPDAPRWDSEDTSALVAGMQVSGITHLYIDFSSRQIKHAMGMDFFIAEIPVNGDGRYFSHDGIVETMEKKYGIAQYFTREDLYRLSAIGGFDIYLDTSGRDWHYVERAAIEERAQYSRSLRFIRHFWLMENYVLEEVARDGTAVLYEINYELIKRLRNPQKNFKGGRLKDLNRGAQLTPEIQTPNEEELTLYKKQEAEGMI